MLFLLGFVFFSGGQTGELQRSGGFALLFLILGAQGGQVVERRFGPGRRRRLGGQVLDADMTLLVLDQHAGLANGIGVQEQLDVRKVEGVEAQFEPAAGQAGVDLVGVALQVEGGVLAHLAELAPQEGFAQDLRIGGADLLQASLVALQRGLSGLGMFVAVVDQLQPGPERTRSGRPGW